jgi:hypothetical protein
MENYMLTKKLLVVVVGAVMALSGGSALFAEENKDQASGVVWAVIGALASRLASIIAEEEVATEHTPPAFEVLHIKANADVKVHLADTPRIVITAPSSLHEKNEPPRPEGRGI